MRLRLTPGQRAAYLAAWAVVTFAAVYVIWGWVAAPVTCGDDCESMRRFMSVFAAVFAPIFADISVQHRDR